MFVYMYIETFIDTNIHNVLRVCWCLSLPIYVYVSIICMYTYMYVICICVFHPYKHFQVAKHMCLGYQLMDVNGQNCIVVTDMLRSLMLHSEGRPGTSHYICIQA